MMGKRSVGSMIAIALYVLFSALGLTLMKLGINQGLSLGITQGIFKFEISLTTLLGIVLYVCSFAMSMVVMSRMNLTYFYPLSAGLVYILVCLLGVFLLKETVQMQQWIGMGFIMVGVIAMNMGRA